MIYFVQVGDDGPIKIGVARNPARRVAALQTSSPFPLRLVAAAEGGRNEERWLHEEFAHARIRGEWFTPTEGMAQLMREGDLELARTESLRAKMRARKR